MLQQQALAPLIGISNLARHLKAPQRRVSVRAARQDSLTSNQVGGGYDPLLTYRLSSACKESILKLVPEEQADIFE